MCICICDLFYLAIISLGRAQGKQTYIIVLSVLWYRNTMYTRVLLNLKTSTSMQPVPQVAPVYYRWLPCMVLKVDQVWEEQRANRSDKGCRTIAASKAHYFADW